jgi:hypothetical protein
MLQVRKNFLFLSLIFFVNMMIGRKLLPPCSVSLKVHSTILRIANMLRMKCFMFSGVGKVCWEKVMHGMAHEGLKKIFNLPQVYTYLEKENPC